MPRPAADVVVPVAARDAAALRAIVARMARVVLAADDTLTVVDNRAVGVIDDARVLVAADVHTSYAARNAGAARGAAPWIVFLDADVEPPADLLDRLLDPPPDRDVGVLAGGILDEPPRPGAPAAVRYAARKASLADATTREGRGVWAFAQTAHAAVRRGAFDQLGGFDANLRSGGDADLCWRARATGWRLEPRPHARVVHRSRTTVRTLLANRFRHGSGAAWLNAHHPGSMPPRRWPGLVLWGLQRAAAGLIAAARHDTDAAIEGLLDGPAVWAFELGRLVPNRELRRQRR